MPKSAFQNNRSTQQGPVEKPQTKPHNRIKTSLYHFVGGIFFLLGLVGIFIPLLPTTIFWIIAAFIYAKGHPHLQEKIYQWPVIGQTVFNFVEHGTITRKSKGLALVGIVTISGLSLYLTQPPIAVTSAVLFILISVMIYVYTRPDEPENNP